MITFRGEPAGGEPAGGAAASGASQPAAVVIVDRGTGHRPGVLFVTAPGSSGSPTISQITATLQTVPGR